MTPRTLTHDERKAADAAFTGQPVNPAWSTRAKRIYDGILAARTSDPVRQTAATPESAMPITPRRAFMPSDTDTPRPLQVWHLTLTHPDERLLFLFPWHVPMPAVLQYLDTQYPRRPITLQAVEGGQILSTPDHSLVLARPLLTSQETAVHAGEDPQEPSTTHA
ncbi:MAG: hypothetical protein ABL983_00230 [Nitrospira sp.]|jgi:hypothetical protein